MWVLRRGTRARRPTQSPFPAPQNHALLRLRAANPGARNRGAFMGKIAVLVAVLMASSSPAFAKAKKVKPAPKPAVISQNEASGRLVRDALPLFLPSAAQVVYFSTQKDASK